MLKPLSDPLDQAIAQRELLSFIEATCEDYLVGWFHREVCAKLDKFLEDVLAKRNPRLMLFAPPRHGKSEIVSRRFPAYALGRNPNLSLIAASYGSDLSSRINRDVQRIIDDPKYSAIFPKTTLNGSNVRTVAHGSYLRNSDIFEIVGARGGYRSAGVGGGITGMGADILIVDDPIKDAQQAYSDTYRQTAWDWFTTTAYTRLMPGGGVLIILTRWHDDDLAGRLLKAEAEGGEHWEVVSYPAIAEAAENHRAIGDALHPERYAIEQLNSIKQVVGSFAWASLYQQSPVPAGGGMFPAKWWRFWSHATRGEAGPRPDGCSSIPPRRLPEKFDTVSMSVDANFKEAATSDFVAITVWGSKGPDRYLLHVFHERVGFAGTLKAIREIYETFPHIDRVLIEDKANGSAIIETLKSEMSGIIEINPEGGKDARAAACQPEIESGNVLLPEGAPWLGDFVVEFSKFPNGKNDDLVDSTTQLLISEKSSDARRIAMLCQL